MWVRIYLDTYSKTPFAFCLSFCPISYFMILNDISQSFKRRESNTPTGPLILACYCWGSGVKGLTGGETQTSEFLRKLGLVPVGFTRFLGKWNILFWCTLLWGISFISYCSHLLTYMRLGLSERDFGLRIYNYACNFFHKEWNSMLALSVKTQPSFPSNLQFPLGS